MEVVEVSVNYLSFFCVLVLASLLDRYPNDFNSPRLWFHDWPALRLGYEYVRRGILFLFLIIKYILYYMYAVCLWLALCGWSCEHNDRDRFFILLHQKTQLPLLLQLLCLYISLPTNVTSDLHCTTFRNCEQKLNMPAFINHSNMFSLGAKSAYHSSRLLSRLANYLYCASSLSLYALVFLITCHCSLTSVLPHLEWYLWFVRRRLWIKGTQQRWLN